VKTSTSFLLTTKLSKQLKQEKKRRNISWESVIEQSVEKGCDAALNSEKENREETGKYLGGQYVSISNTLKKELQPATEDSDMTLGEAARVAIAEGVQELQKEQKGRVHK